MIDRYLLPEMKDLFSEENKFNKYLQVEIASLKGWASIGVIKEDEVLKVEKNAHVDVNRIHEIEEVTKHDVIAFTRQISETLGDEKRYVHYGLTSTDVVDTALSLLYKDANDIILKHLSSLLQSIKNKAIEYKYTPCIGRTHGMHAEVITFGFKFANYYDEIKRGIDYFSRVRKLVETCKLTGAVGNYADIDPRVQEYAAKYLDLESAPISTQVLSRDRHEYYASCLCIIASSIEKIAVEIRNLSRTEIHEVEEGFTKGQKGSSAMPQKRNPISSENITGLSRMIRGYLLPILEDNALYHERDISHSSVERVALVDMIELFTYMVNRMNNVIDNLTVFKDKMIENINITSSSIYSSNILKLLIEKGMSREESYDLIQNYAMSSSLGKSNFKDDIMKDKNVTSFLSKEEIENAFSYKNSLKNIDYIYSKLGLN